MNFLRRKKRTATEKIANSPIRVMVGPRGGKQIELELREPTMQEFMEFLETSVGKLVPVFSKRMSSSDWDRLAKGQLAVTDFRLLSPALEPFCDFIAQLAVYDGRRGKLHRMVTTAQFIEIVNKMFYLVDLPALYLNFSEALASMLEAQKMAGVRKSSLSAQ